MSLTCASVCHFGFTSIAAVEVTRDDERVRIVYDNDVELSFALADGYLLGLQTASVDGVATTAADTVYRPTIASDLLGTPVLGHRMVLTDIQQDGEIGDLGLPPGSDQ